MGRWFLILIGLLVSCLCQGKEKINHRQKRILWITNDGRLALPPGTLLTITPTISMPFVRYPPEGFLSNMTISLPFTINFDMLGLTDNQNPYGALPPLIARGLGRSAGALLADYVAGLFNNRRSSRATSENVPPNPASIFHGGERALLYVVVEDFLSNFGLDGKACLLRAICEVHGYSLRNLGFFGEILKLFFTFPRPLFIQNTSVVSSGLDRVANFFANVSPDMLLTSAGQKRETSLFCPEEVSSMSDEALAKKASKSPFADILSDYVKAERQGVEHGECFPYYKKCPKSLFLASNNNPYVMKDSEHDADEEVPEEDIEETSKLSFSNHVLGNKNAM